MHAPRDVVARALRLPAAPSPPAGTPESTLEFRAARNYYRYTLIQWGLKQAGAFLGLLTFILIDSAVSIFPNEIPEPIRHVVEVVEGREDETPGATRIFSLVESVGLALLLLQLPFTLMLVRLNYEMRWYIVTDRSLRIREGVGRMRELTMSLVNIQNLSVRQGPIQRLLGISDLRVRTAGGGEGMADVSELKSAGGDAGHVAYFRGVDNAGEIRDLILERLSAIRSGGLGDPDDTDAETPAVPIGPIRPAQEVLVEVRRLRVLLVGPDPRQGET